MLLWKDHVQNSEIFVIEITAEKDANSRGEIWNVGIYHSSDNVVDGLTKEKGNDFLQQDMETGEFYVFIQLWIKRTTINSKKKFGKSG